MSFKDIISIHGVPRSGTTWLGQIIDSSPNVRYKYQPLFSYAFKNRICLDSTKNEILEFYSTLYNYSDDFLDQIKQKESGTYPIFTKKNDYPSFLVTKMVRYHYLIPHLIKVLENIKFIFIVRNPCGSLNSWKNAPREFNKDLWDFHEQWEFGQCRNNFRPEEYFGYHKWKEATKLFLEMEQSHAKNVLLIRYEDLVRNPLSITQDLYKFCGFELTNQTKEFIRKSTSIKQDDVYSVFKGKKNVNDWRGDLDEHIVSYVYEDLKNTDFERFL
ncbi:sulfotransferase [Bacillus sp. AFS040349]|uniref:sulfotransferase family protein n=1 Tax=Bacillus sp. AFS040349 TaxID=2033502 RepID=UPI000BFE23BE|nr:sulfotransferase [Bacillus sp. AFS040349]PGT81123.1 hypothetical protein COD11_18895 [Bacillus sp. AFS040349]